MPFKLDTRKGISGIMESLFSILKRARKIHTKMVIPLDILAILFQ